VDNCALRLGARVRINARTTFQGARNAPGKPSIEIGDDVWIAEGATVLGGVTIGEGAVVAAHAVVTKDVPPRCVAAGNPARVIREIESPRLEVA
jgi:acetyltransferase-like isoleucine patch superfamily enzyme